MTTLRIIILEQLEYSVFLSQLIAYYLICEMRV